MSAAKDGRQLRQRNVCNASTRRKTRARRASVCIRCTTEIVRDYHGMLWTLFASVTVLLLVGCVNLANLLLVRAAGRQHGVRRASLARRVATPACVPTARRISVSRTGRRRCRRDPGRSRFVRMARVGAAGFPADAHARTRSRMSWHSPWRCRALTAIACGVAPAWFASCGSAFAVRDAARTATAARAQRAVQRGADRRADGRSDGLARRHGGDGSRSGAAGGIVTGLYRRATPLRCNCRCRRPPTAIATRSFAFSTPSTSGSARSQGFALQASSRCCL